MSVRPYVYVDVGCLVPMGAPGAAPGDCVPTMIWQTCSRRHRPSSRSRWRRLHVGDQGSTPEPPRVGRTRRHVGGPGSGKTTFLQLLIEASAGQQPVVVVDPKGSPALAETVRAHGGQVWTLDGRLPADLMDPRPWQVPDLLLEAEDYSVEARVFRDAAHQRALWASWALALNGEPMDLAKLRRLLDREDLVMEPHRGRDARIGEWIERFDRQRGGIEDSGARGLDRSLGTLLDGVAMRGSLRSCPEALRLEDVLDTRGVVLFSLDVADYPHATRKVASWVLLGMGRLARQLPERWARHPLSGEPRGPEFDAVEWPRLIDTREWPTCCSCTTYPADQ